VPDIGLSSSLIYKTNRHVAISQGRYLPISFVSLDYCVLSSSSATFTRMRPRWTGLSFVSFVGTAIVRKANERWVEYKRVSPEKVGKLVLQNFNSSVLFDDEDVTYGLESSYPDNLSIRKLFPSTGRYKRRRRCCCVCCGTNCASRWKAIGTVLGIVALWHLAKLTSWAISVGLII